MVKAEKTLSRCYYFVSDGERCWHITTLTTRHDVLPWNALERPPRWNLCFYNAKGSSSPSADTTKQTERLMDAPTPVDKSYNGMLRLH